MTTHIPNPAENAALKRIASMRAGLPLVLFANLAAIASAMLLRNGLVGAILPGSAALIVLGTLAYVSFEPPRVFRRAPCVSHAAKA